MRVRDAHRYWTGAMPDADFRERRKAEVQLPRTPLLRTRVNNLFGECARLSSPAVSLEGGPQRRLATSAGTAGRIVSALSYPPHAPGKHQQADTPRDFTATAGPPRRRRTRPPGRASPTGPPRVRRSSFITFFLLSNVPYFSPPIEPGHHTTPELPRTPLPRTPVNRGKKKTRDRLVRMLL